MMTYIHSGAKFEYTNKVTNSPVIITVDQITMAIDDQADNAAVYFQNNLEDRTYSLSPREFHNSLKRVNARKIA